MLIATEDFSAFTGIAPDFIIPPLIQSVDGMVCFQANPSNPNFPVNQCLAYGNYQGPEESDACGLLNGPPAPPLESSGLQPLSLNRVADLFGDFGCGTTNADFQLQTPAPTNTSGTTGQVAALSTLEQGSNIFSRERFNGNGRRCADCHNPGDDFGLEPATIISQFALNPQAPLFVAEQVLGLSNLENPCLMRMGDLRGLILENIDGFGSPPVFRGSPHLLNIAATGPFGLSGEFESLSAFSQGAVAQHFTRTLLRNADPSAGPIDFRRATEFELQALDFFMSSITFPSDGNLDLDRMINFHASQNGADFPAIQRGRELFFGNRAQCSRCHSGPALADSDGSVFLNTNNFNTGTVNVIANQDDGCAGGPGDPLLSLPQEANGEREFNTPALVGIARTAPFFHDNSAETLLDAVLFYDSTEFRASPAGQLLVTPTVSNPTPLSISFTFAEAADIVSFLEAISVDPTGGPGPTCSDGLDNDADGFIDLADDDCPNSFSEESGSSGGMVVLNVKGFFASNLFGSSLSTIANPEPIMLEANTFSSMVGRTEAFDLTLTLDAGRFAAPLPSLGPSGSGAELEVGGALGAGTPQEWTISQISGSPGSSELRYRFTPTLSASPVESGVLVMVKGAALRTDALHQVLSIPGRVLSISARFLETSGTQLRLIQLLIAESIQGVEVSAPDSSTGANLNGLSPIFESNEVVVSTAGICTGFPGGFLSEHANCSQADTFRVDPVNDRLIVQVSSDSLPEFLRSQEDRLMLVEGTQCDGGTILAESVGPISANTLSMTVTPPSDVGFIFVACLETHSNQAVSKTLSVSHRFESGALFLTNSPDPLAASTWTLSPRCFGDFNGDLSVDNSDAFIFQGCFPCSQDGLGIACDPACDFDLDGRVNNSDARAFQMLFGATCEQRAGPIATLCGLGAELALGLPILILLNRKRKLWRAQMRPGDR